MPAEWLTDMREAPAHAGASSVADGPPAAELRLWPHRSLSLQGFSTFILATFALLQLPLLAVLGTPVLWALLPFLMGALALLWAALRRSYRDGTLTETLSLWSDRIELVRHNPDGAAQRWRADPYWVSVHLHEEGGPVENYVTLRGGGREVEIGAFLTPEERLALHEDLEQLLARLPRPARF